MSTPEPDLSYHLRELRADLRSVQAALEEVTGASLPPPGLVRAWIGVESALDHDLDVHIPGALKLLGVRELEPRGGVKKGATSQPDEIVGAAGDVRDFVDAALAALDGPQPTAAHVAQARDAILEALPIAREARDAAITANT